MEFNGFIILSNLQQHQHLKFVSIVILHQPRLALHFVCYIALNFHFNIICHILNVNLMWLLILINRHI
jgi:hypothetical protein